MIYPAGSTSVALPHWQKDPLHFKENEEKPDIEILRVL